MPTMLTFEMMVRTGNSGERFVSIYQAGKQEGNASLLNATRQTQTALGVVEKKKNGSKSKDNIGTLKE